MCKDTTAVKFSGTRWDNRLNEFGTRLHVIIEVLCQRVLLPSWLWLCFFFWPLLSHLWLAFPCYCPIRFWIDCGRSTSPGQSSFIPRAPTSAWPSWRLRVEHLPPLLDYCMADVGPGGLRLSCFSGCRRKSRQLFLDPRSIAAPLWCNLLPELSVPALPSRGPRVPSCSQLKPAI
jgi:hypothetical protein